MNQQESVAEKPMKVRDVAAYLGVSGGWVRNHITKKKPMIPHTRIGRVVRFYKPELEAFLAKYGVRDEAA